MAECNTKKVRALALLRFRLKRKEKKAWLGERTDQDIRKKRRQRRKLGKKGQPKF